MKITLGNWLLGWLLFVIALVFGLTRGWWLLVFGSFLYAGAWWLIGFLTPPSDEQDPPEDIR